MAFAEGPNCRIFVSLKETQYGARKGPVGKGSQPLTNSLHSIADLWARSRTISLRHGAPSVLLHPHADLRAAIKQPWPVKGDLNPINQNKNGSKDSRPAFTAT